MDKEKYDQKTYHHTKDILNVTSQQDINSKKALSSEPQTHILEQNCNCFNQESLPDVKKQSNKQNENGIRTLVKNSKKHTKKEIISAIICGAVTLTAFLSGIGSVLGFHIFDDLYIFQSPNKHPEINENDNEINTEKFIPDYTPGKENVRSDTVYKNNYGFFSKQDEMYYFATTFGIYKMTSSLEKCELVSDDSYPKFLNVLGDWIYYATIEGIYKIKTNGSNKTLIIQLDGYPIDMSIANGMIYYIKPDDLKLYSNSIVGNCERCLIDRNTYKFIITDWGIYFIQTEIERNYDGTITYHIISLNRFEYENGNIHLILENSYDSDGRLIDNVPLDLCDYKSWIAFCNYFGLFLMDKTTGRTKKIDDTGGYGLCVL